MNEAPHKSEFFQIKHCSSIDLGVDSMVIINGLEKFDCSRLRAQGVL